jgi:hypothetical protein
MRKTAMESTLFKFRLNKVIEDEEEHGSYIEEKSEIIDQEE